MELEPLQDPKEVEIVKELIQSHQRLTGSHVAERILADWAKSQGDFVKIIPSEYKAALQRQDEVQAETVA